MKKEKDEKGNKIVFIVYIIISIGFFICAIEGFIDGTNRAVVQLCIGACFLCLSLVYYTRYRDENKENTENKE